MDKLDYEQIVALHHENLYRFAFSLASNPDDAAELTQETYVRLLIKGSQLRDLASKRNKEYLRRLLQSHLSADAFVNGLSIANERRLAAPPALRTPFSAQSYRAGAIFASAQQS